MSVLSALARLGLDPWDEAARLAHLTREAAADQLARMITGLYDRRWGTSEASRIASGLVERLPAASASVKDDLAAWITMSTIGLRSPSFLIYLAMALAMLVSLIASGYLSSGS